MCITLSFTEYRIRIKEYLTVNIKVCSASRKIYPAALTEHTENRNLNHREEILCFQPSKNYRPG